MVDKRSGQFLLDGLQQGFSVADCHVNAQGLKDALVFGVVDPGDYSSDLKFALGDLADYQIIFVVASDGDYYIGPPSPGRSQDSGFTGITLHHYAAELFGVLLDFG